jgi:hypothetical protein
MRKDDMKKALDAIASSRRAIRIRTKHPDGTVLAGFILRNARSFLVIQEVTSFELDGIIILPKRWLRGICNGKNERGLNSVLQNVMNVASVSIDSAYGKLDTVAEILAHLKAESIWPAIEVVYKREASIYIGPITTVSEKAFKVYCYDAAGEWEKEYELEYSEIFKIEIDSKYVRHFNEYMKGKRQG